MRRLPPDRREPRRRAVSRPPGGNQSPPSASGTEVLPFQAVEETLKNGLKVIVGPAAPLGEGPVRRKDAKALKDQLVADAFSPIQYDAEKPADLLAEDKVIGARKLGLGAGDVRITPVEEVFAK